MSTKKSMKKSMTKSTMRLTQRASGRVLLILRTSPRISIATSGLLLRSM